MLPRMAGSFGRRTCRFSAHSAPGTYQWGGKRYVVVCAGGHGKVDGSKLGGAVIAFTGD